MKNQLTFWTRSYQPWTEQTRPEHSQATYGRLKLHKLGVQFYLGGMPLTLLIYMSAQALVNVHVFNFPQVLRGAADA